MHTAALDTFVLADSVMLEVDSIEDRALSASDNFSLAEASTSRKSGSGSHFAAFFCVLLSLFALAAISPTSVWSVWVAILAP